jgi:hypothetical protein
VVAVLVLISIPLARVLLEEARAQGAILVAMEGLELLTLAAVAVVEVTKTP